MSDLFDSSVDDVDSFGSSADGAEGVEGADSSADCVRPWLNKSIPPTLVPSFSKLKSLLIESSSSSSSSKSNPNEFIPSRLVPSVVSGAKASRFSPRSRLPRLSPRLRLSPPSEATLPREPSDIKSSRAPVRSN